MSHGPSTRGAQGAELVEHEAGAARGEREDEALVEARLHVGVRLWFTHPVVHASSCGDTPRPVAPPRLRLRLCAEASVRVHRHRVELAQRVHRLEKHHDDAAALEQAGWRGGEAVSGQEERREPAGGEGAGGWGRRRGGRRTGWRRRGGGQAFCVRRRAAARASPQHGGRRRGRGGISASGLDEHAAKGRRCAPWLMPSEWRAAAWLQSGGRGCEAGAKAWRASTVSTVRASTFGVTASKSCSTSMPNVLPSTRVVSR